MASHATYRRLHQLSSIQVHSNLAAHPQRSRRRREQGQCDMRATSVPLLSPLGRIDGLPRNRNTLLEGSIPVAGERHWQHLAKQRLGLVVAMLRR
jgi:hypothetical protein